MSTETNSEELFADSPTADSNSPDNRGDPSQQEQPQQQHVYMSGNPAEEGSGGSVRPGDESYGSGPGDRTEIASSAPLPASPHRERKPATDSNKADSQQLLEKLPSGSPPPVGIQRPPIPSEAIDTQQNQQQPQPSVQRDQSMLIPIPSPAADTSVVGGVPVQQMEGGSTLVGGAGHGGGSGEGDITVDATSDGSRQPSTAFDMSVCAQQQQAVVHPTSSMIDPSLVAAAAASADRQPASPSRPSPFSTPSPITPDQQDTANVRQGQKSASDAAAVISLAADALLAGDIGLFVSHVEKLASMPRLPDDDPSVKRLVGLLAKTDEAHRQQGQGGLAGCIVAIFNDGSNQSHQSAAASFLKRLCKAGYPFGVEWLPLFGVLVDAVLGRRTLPDHVWVAAVLLSKSIPETAEVLSAFQQHIFCHVDALVETLVTSSDQVIVWRTYKLIGIIFRDARRFPSELGVLVPICRSVSASPAAMGKMAKLNLYLSVPIPMAECGYCERVAQAGFLSAAMSILQSDRLIKDAGHERSLYLSVVSKFIYLINLCIDRETYASCEGLAELMWSQLSEFVARDTARLASAAPDGSTVSIVMGVLDSLASYWDRQVTSGKSKDNPIVERILQVDISALSGPPTAASQNSLIQMVFDFFAKYRRRKEAIDRWVSSQHDPHREAARQENKQNRLVRCLSDKRVLHTIYQLVGPLHFTAAHIAMLALSCRSLLDALCPVCSTDRISSYANRELLAPFASISVSKQNRLVAALARYSPDTMLELSIRCECSPTADDISDLIDFLQRADRLMTLQLMCLDLTQLPDDECAQLADAIGRVPSLATLHLEDEDLSRAFIDRLSALLKAQPEEDGKGDSSSESASSPPPSSRDVTRTHSTSSAAVPAGSKEERHATTEAGQTADTGDDKKERPFTTLRASMGSMERLFGTIACKWLSLSFCSVAGLSLPVVKDTVMSAATAGLKTNPNRRTLKQLYLLATANAIEPFLRFALKDLTLERLCLSSSEPLSKLISQQFLSSGDFASLVHGAVTRAHDERESELRAARSVKDRQWAADDARLPPAADAAEGDRRRAARERREEGLQAEEKELRSSPPFLLDLRDVPLADASTSRMSFPDKHLQVIEDMNKQYKFRRSVIDTFPARLSALDSVGWPLTPIRRSLCRALVLSYDPISPLVWAQTVASKGPSLLLLYFESLSHKNRGADSAFGFRNPFSVTVADLAMYRDCVRELEALKDVPAINNITQEDVDAARTALTEAVRLGQEKGTVHLAALFEKQKRLQVIENLLATLQTKLDDLEAQVQTDKAALSKAGRKGIDTNSLDNRIATLAEQINKNTAARAEVLREIDELQRMVTGERPAVEDQPKSRCDVVREELREKLESRKKLKAKKERRMKRQADKEPDEAVSAKMAAEEAAARRNEKDLLRSIGEQVSDESEDQQRQGEGGQQQHGEGGKKAKKKKRPKTKRPPAAPVAASGPPPLAAAVPSIAADGSPSVRDGEGEVDGGLEYLDSEPSSSPLYGPAVAAGGAAATSAAQESLQHLSVAPCMPPLPDIGCDSDDLLSVGAVSEDGGGGDGLAGEGAGETDGRAGNRDDGCVSGGEETEAMRARVAVLEAELMRRDWQIEATRRESMEMEAAFQQQLHAAQQETLAARQEIERFREAQMAGEQTVAATLAANERLQADMRQANEAHRQQLSQQHQRLTSDIDRERSLRQQQAAEMGQLQHHLDRHKRAAAEREESLRQEVTSLREENASVGEANRGLQADIDQLRSSQIDRLTERFGQLTTADEFSGFAMQLADRQTALTTSELPQLQSLERRAQQAAQQRRETELRQEMQQEMQRQMEERTDCQICQERERSVVLRPCNHFCICLQCAQTMQPRQCPLCRQAFTGWNPAIFS
ncbi:unnamed protein product [Vitrella brassicaformis CCMP3155]|uniref:RING-type domain-containing protein n=1 Tax=Vitrella brassicaformis (strain CCMP3155) TaxID=1169540 RepID=A0A0G4EEA6_VITBC|nr:unnamed protein product [Vitrella brassicaformis CCMP3155]|eukprot:CEL94317.1 unnamed protein product [Vitrella brassicaformis CCMP3155]